ncbi:MAG: M15 family metallopeptidase [Leptospiraceae bacterium]|nr:M15 family metallopeptidase [Leptospiraceae bacterium]
MKFKKILILIMIFHFCFPSESENKEKTQEELNLEEILPDKITKKKNESTIINYLMGKYNSKEYLKEHSDQFYLREEVIQKFKEMLTAYQEYSQKNEDKKLPKMYISSAFRKFEHQKGIWERKYKKYSEEIEDKNPEQIVSSILEYSSAPGTSRHHWGTDFDINTLENDYFEIGEGKDLFIWLAENAKKYGFCQPYNKRELRGKKGYFEEKWHWSYYPISNHLQKEWERLYNTKKIKISGFKGSEIMNKRALDYVNSINEECFIFEENMENIPDFNEKEDGVIP